MRIGFVVLLLLSSLVAAWHGETHAYFAKQLCQRHGCGFESDAAEGAVAPDRVFHDTSLHHLYDPATCIPSNASLYNCPKVFDDVALRKTGEWLDRAKGQTGAERWYSIGVASHYFFDSKNFWHTVVNESRSCHNSFESAVDEQVRNGAVVWRVCRCGVCVASSEFEPWIDEFDLKLDFVGNERSDVFSLIGATYARIVRFITLAFFATSGSRPSS